MQRSAEADEPLPRWGRRGWAQPLLALPVSFSLLGGVYILLGHAVGGHLAKDGPLDVEAHQRQRHLGAHGWVEA